MRRDFLFLVIGIPTGQFVRDKNYFVASPDTDTQKKFQEIAKWLPGLQAFLLENHTSTVVCIGVRNDFKEEKEAADSAWTTLSGIVDGYSLLIDASVPKVSSFFLIRTGDELDVAIKAYGEGGWAHISSMSTESGKQWQEVKGKLFNRMLRFFDVAVRLDPKCQTPLAHQLLYSVRMFRHGTDSRVFGIQFLCKFSALEGIVCGSANRSKEALLKERLRHLLRRNNRPVEAEVKELWELRCSASHQAKAFRLMGIPGSVTHGAYIDRLEYMFRAALVFALDNLDTSTTVEDLWSKVSGYELPDYALSERPADIPRFAVESALLDPKLVWKGAGLTFDNLYEQ